MFIYQQTKYDDMASLLNQDFFAAQTALQSFEWVAGYLDPADENLTGAGAPMRVSAGRVTANFSPMLRVAPVLGRNFLSSEDRKGGPAVVILSHRLRQGIRDANSLRNGYTFAKSKKCRCCASGMAAALAAAICQCTLALLQVKMVNVSCRSRRDET